MFKKILFYFFLVFKTLCFSQEYNIEGSVIDSNNSPISYANIVIIDKENSEFITGSTTNEVGAFTISAKKAQYIIKVSFLGFETFSKEFKVDSDLDLGTILLKENLQELDGVTIISKRPTIKRMVDRLVFNVENSTLSNNNILDVLKHTPGVLVVNGKITVKNALPIIYINDRRMHLSPNEVQQLLEGTSANNIKSIEVITSPPAKYEAEGGAVINIKTSKNITAGYNGSVYGNYKQGSEFPKYAFGTSHFFKTKKLSTYINYSDSPRTDFRNTNEFVNFIENDEIQTSWETDYNRTRKTANKNLNANIDYDFNKLNSIGFTTNILFAPRANSRTNVNSFTEVFNSNKVLDSTFFTENKKHSETVNFAFTIDYNHKFNTNGEQLGISLHHTNYDFSDLQEVNTQYLFSDETFIRNNKFQTFSSQDIKLFTGQIDYELPANDSSLFEAGLKISSINSKSILNQDNFKNGIPEKDLLNSDTFFYDETNFALYSSYSQDWDTWSLKLGLRTEFTDIKGNSLFTNENNNRKYNKFFPSFYLLHTIDDKNEIYFNYNKRIHRPRYSDLNPFKYFLNDNTYTTGDPNLSPQIDDGFILGYTFKQIFTFEAFYRFERHPTIEIKFQDNEENIIKYINTNIDRSFTYGLDFTTYTPVVNDWNLYVLSSIFYYDNQFFAIESNNVLQNTKQWSFYAQIINYFSFLEDKSLTADVSYVYISPLVNGASNISERCSFDINLRKDVWNGRASISLGVADMFNALNFSQTTKYLNQDVYYKSKIENRLFTFGFNYKFGNFRLNNNKKEIESIERDRIK